MPKLVCVFLYFCVCIFVCMCGVFVLFCYQLSFFCIALYCVLMCGLQDAQNASSMPESPAGDHKVYEIRTLYLPL